jgi:hypothetical protein
MKTYERNPRKPYFYQKLYRKIEIIYENIIGVDFSTVTPVKEFGLDENLVVHGAPCGSRYLKNVLKKINISETDSILDIGSAKGSSIHVFTKFNFGKISGIELTAALVNIAKNNFKKLNENRVDFVCGDAIYFKKYDQYNFFYLCNPFPESIFKLFLSELLNQISSDKNIYIIYNNPVCDHVLIDNGLYRIGQFPDAYGNGIFVYSNIDRKCTGNKFFGVN